MHLKVMQLTLERAQNGDISGTAIKIVNAYNKKKKKLQDNKTSRSYIGIDLEKGEYTLFVTTYAEEKLVSEFNYNYLYRVSPDYDSDKLLDVVKEVREEASRDLFNEVKEVFENSEDGRKHLMLTAHYLKNQPFVEKEVKHEV